MRQLDRITTQQDEHQQTLGDRGGERSLLCYIPWDPRVRHNLVTGQQNYVSHNFDFAIRFVIMQKEWVFSKH